MVQINLPKNSKIQQGHYYKDKTGSQNIRKVNIYRWDPATGENPRKLRMKLILQLLIEGHVHMEFVDHVR